MPYVDCPHCRLTVYNAVPHAVLEACPRCETPLGTPPRSLFSGGRPGDQPAVKRVRHVLAERRTAAARNGRLA